jgi:hypothetical protein
MSLLGQVVTLTGLYIDVYGGSTAAGGLIDAWPYNGGYANQYFLSFPG